MNQRPLNVPFFDPAKLTAAEQRELVDLQSAFEANPTGPALTHLNLLQGRATADAWLYSVTDRDRQRARVGGSAAPAPAPVTDDRRDRDRDRLKASKRDRYDDIDDMIHDRHRPKFWGGR